MNVHAKKALPNPRKITFDLTVKQVRMPQSELLVPYTTRLRQYAKDGKALMDIVDNLERLFTSKKEDFSMIAEVKVVLESVELEKDAKGRKLKGLDGRYQAIPFSIEIQRLVKVIMDPIYDAIDEWDEKNKGKHKNLKFKIAPKYAIYLCDRMIEQCSEYNYSAGHIIDMHDYFLVKKSEAETVQKMIKSGADDETIDKAVKAISIDELLEEDEDEEKDK